jgi:hypothetical protein
MSSVGGFIEDESRHERRLAEVMGWEYVTGQQKGSCWDYLTPDGSKIEAKFDWDSIKTGNHYLEFTQTSDGGTTWVPSGFTLSADEADYWVVVNDDWLRMFEMEALKEFVRAHRGGFKVTRTRIGVNFNRPGQMSQAYLIPYTVLDQHCLLKIESPVQRSSS